MSAFGPFIIDLYLPSLPKLKEYFNTTPALTQVSGAVNSGASQR